VRVCSTAGLAERRNSCCYGAAKDLFQLVGNVILVLKHAFIPIVSTCLSGTVTWRTRVIVSNKKLRQHFHVSGIPETWYIVGVEEGSYRQSRLCRLLGNPVAFAVVQLLAENKARPGFL
jgi:hypothetical protein